MKHLVGTMMGLGLLLALIACPGVSTPRQQVRVSIDRSTPPRAVGASRNVTASSNGDADATASATITVNVSSTFSNDAFLAMYDPDGNQRWIRQFGSDGEDVDNVVAVDADGNAYITGFTNRNLDGSSSDSTDVFLAKNDRDGNQRWIRQFGSDGDDRGYGVAVDGDGNAYITGATEGSLNGSNAGGKDVFLAKYDRDGNQRWIRQFGSDDLDEGYEVAVDVAGNAYITGVTGGSLNGSNAGKTDVFLAKYDRDGNQRWIRQFGSDSYDEGWGVAVDGDGNAYVTGDTGGSLNGSNAGKTDVFLAKYDRDGNQRWIRQFGSDGIDVGYGVTVDGDGNAYVTGVTYGNLDGSSLRMTGEVNAARSVFTREGSRMA